jgi:hypothetical protein
MPDLEQARLVAEALQNLKLQTEIRRIEQILLVKKPPVTIIIMELANLKAKLIRAQRLAIMLEAMLEK